MGFYERTIFPRLMDMFMSAAYLAPLRAEALAGAEGDVLEVGFGTGLNLPHYPTTVERLVAIDPNPGASRLARERVDASRIAVEVRQLGGEKLPFDDASFDTIVSTFTLCSIPDVGRALREIRRVMRPTARFLLLEHGLSDAPSVQKWQRRINPINRLLACGCNLDRDIQGLVEGHGFAFDTLRAFDLAEEPRVFGHMFLGAARSA